MSNKKNRNLPQHNGNHQIGQAIVTQQFSGPIPPPAVLQEYEVVSPGFAERIVAMAENEQRHRIQQETSLNQANIEIAHANTSSHKRGQWMALSVAMSGMLLSAVLVYLGHSITGTLLGGSILASLVGAFLTIQNRSREK